MNLVSHAGEVDMKRLPLDLRVALLYALFSGAWILFSDRLLAALVTDLDALTRLQTYKGWAFVAISALLIFFLLRRELQLRHIAEGGMEESKKQFHTAFDNLIEGAQVIDRDWRYVYLNESASRQGRATRDALIGCTMMQAYPGIETTGLFSALRDCMENRVSRQMENEFSYPDGSRGWFNLSVQPVVDGILILSFDITERKRAEEELRATQELFSNIFHASPLASTLATFPDRNARDVNTAFEKMFGYTRAEMVGKPLTDFDFWADPSERQRAFETASRLGGLLDYEFQFKTRSGKVGYALINTRIIEQSGAKYMLTKLMDITDRKLAEEKLRESNVRLKKVLEVETVGVMFWDLTTGAMTDANDTFLKMTGYSRREVEARELTWQKLTPPEYIEASLAEIEKFQASGRVGPYEKEYFRKDGTRQWLVFAGSSLGGDTCVEFCVDISDRKRAEEELFKLNAELEQRVTQRTHELEIARDRAESADRVKSAFLATMSHELRTPLNSIIGFTGVLLQGLAGPLNAEQTKQMGMARDSARHLLALINDVLDISRIEAGQLEIRRAPFDMRSAIEAAMKLVLPQAQKKGLALAAAIGSNVGEIVSDQRRVEQILINLLNNAVKFTERGEVKLECRVRDGFIETSVHDTGIGIRAEDAAKLFAPFRQVETGLNRRHEGTGLGLSICKNLVEMLGGEIRVESEWGRGSVFTFTLPLT